MSRGSPGAIQAGQAFIQLSLNDKEFRKNLHGARTYMKQWADMLTKVGGSMALAGGGMLAAFGMITKQVANLESAFRRFDLMFGKMAGDMTAELQKVSDATGFPVSALKERAAAFGAIFSEMREDITDDQYVKLVGQAMKAVTDLVALGGMSVEEATQRIISGFTSTGEALDQFGQFVRKANLEAEGARLGMKGSVLTWTEQEKQLLKLSIMMRQTARTGIEFATVGDTINGQLALMSANIREILARTIWFVSGAMVPLLKAMNLLLRLARPLATAFAPLLGVFGALGATLFGGGAVLFGGGLLLHLAEISLGSWLKMKKKIEEFGSFYKAVRAMLVATGAWDLAISAWMRLAAAIAAATAALKAFSVAQLWTMGLVAAGGIGVGVGGISLYSEGMKRRRELNQAYAESQNYGTGISGFFRRWFGFAPKDLLPWSGAPWGGGQGSEKWRRERGLLPAGAEQVASLANRFAPTAVAGTFQQGIAQQLAFATSASGVEKTNELLGGLSVIANKVLEDNQIKVKMGTR